MKKFPVTPNALFGKITAAAVLIAALAASNVAVRAQKTTMRQETQAARAEMSRAELNTKSLEETAAVKEDAGFNIYAPEAITAAGYPFTFQTGVPLDDMSTGTTQLLGAGADDLASTVQNIGFDFWFDGTRQTQFSVNSNGLMKLGAAAVTGTAANALGTTTNAPKLTAYWDDLCVGANGKVHYKVFGSAPNRKLVVEWQNMVQYDNAVGCSAAAPVGTYQVWAYESAAATNPGVVEFVYGAIGANINSNGGYSVGFQSGAATNFASVTTATNTVAYGTANDTQLNAIAAGTAYVFTPNIPAAPTNLTFTATNALSTTLNFTDNASNELGYVIYRSTDGGATFTFLAQTAANATSYTDSGLNPNTQYFYRVYAVTEGALSNPPLAGSVTTAAAGNDTCAGAGGNYSDPTTWADGTVPTAGDNVTIQAGCTVTVDTPGAVALNLTIDNGGTLQSPTAGAVTTNNLTVGANLTNNGTLDFSTNGNTSGAILTFTGASSNTFSGTGATTDIRTITVNKGTSNANVLELTTTNFTVQGVATDVAGYLTITNGTFRISGTFTLVNRTFAVASYTIPATGGFSLNNPNYTVAGQAGSATQSGLLRITQGTFNVGTTTGNSIGFSTGSTTIVEGGAVNTAGRFGVAAAGNVITYTQTGGTITVNTVGNASTTLGSFDLGTSASSTITISGGTIVVQLAATTIDYRNQAGAGIAGVTGGTLQLGNANSGAAKAFSIRGVVPNLLLTNTSANHTASFSTTIVTYNNISLNITVSPGTTLNFGNAVFLFAGAVLTNNGTIVHNGASSRFITFSSTVAQSYTGSGVVTAPLNSFEVQSDLGFTFDPSVSQIVTNRVIIFVGNIINSNKLTVGSGGTSTAVIQIGNTTTPTNAGTFDSTLTFNPGTGGIVISYLRTTTSRVTGGEIPASRTITNLTYDDNDPAHTLTIAGGGLVVTGALTLTNGIILTGTNTLVHSGGAAARTNGFVVGNLRREYTAVGAYTYFVGDNSGTAEYSPMTANVTALGTTPSSLTVFVVDNTLPGLNPSQAASRYWVLTEDGDLTADLSFTYVDADVNGDETKYSVFKRPDTGSGNVTNQCGGVACVNPATNTAGPATGITSFSQWGVGQFDAILVPTAAGVSVSGRAMTSTGRGIRNVLIKMTDESGNARIAYTTSLGYYRFTDVAAGETYVFTVKGKRFEFAQPTQVLNIGEDTGGVNFIATQ